MKKRQRSTIPIELDSSNKSSKRQKKIILNTDNLTSPNSSTDHSSKSEDKHSSSHKHSHKHNHNHSHSHSGSSHSNSENENDDSTNGEKKEKIIIQIKNTNVKKKKEKFIIQIKNDKRKKGSSAPNSASADGPIDLENNKKNLFTKERKNKINIITK